VAVGKGNVAAAIVPCVLVGQVVRCRFALTVRRRSGVDDPGVTTRMEAIVGVIKHDGLGRMGDLSQSGRRYCFVAPGPHPRIVVVVLSSAVARADVELVVLDVRVDIVEPPDPSTCSFGGPLDGGIFPACPSVAKGVTLVVVLGVG